MRKFNKLNQALALLKKTYKEEYIFGIFLYDDEKICSVIVPTFEEVCFNGNILSTTLKNELCEVKVVDARLVYKATKNGYPEVIQAIYTDYCIINPRYQHIYTKLLRSNRAQISEGIRKGIPAEELKIALLKLMRAVYNDNSSVVKFIKQLTDIEKTAIEQIVAAIGDEGVFSQAKVASAAGISRAAMTNLVLKMQLSGVAEIQYAGNKGTYIKILDDTLLRIRE